MQWEAETLRRVRAGEDPSVAYERVEVTPDPAAAADVADWHAALLRREGRLVH